jgi:hypothetical protein
MSYELSIDTLQVLDKLRDIGVASGRAVTFELVEHSHHDRGAAHSNAASALHLHNTNIQHTRHQNIAISINC